MKAVIRTEIGAAVQQRSKWEQIAGFVLLKVWLSPQMPPSVGSAA